mmetsp:Transcript_20589/g.41687  ORF Transcript_20589/g.41687 Transcript_20589/m.41687 type:complete len:394 (-) Transcript_20589:322-1503(-)
MTPIGRYGIKGCRIVGRAVEMHGIPRLQTAIRGSQIQEVVSDRIRSRDVHGRSGVYLSEHPPPIFSVPTGGREHDLRRRTVDQIANGVGVGDEAEAVIVGENLNALGELGGGENFALLVSEVVVEPQQERRQGRRRRRGGGWRPRRRQRTPPPAVRTPTQHRASEFLRRFEGRVPQRHVLAPRLLHGKYVHVVGRIRVDHYVRISRFGWQKVEFDQGGSGGGVGTTDRRVVNFHQLAVAAVAAVAARHQPIDEILQSGRPGAIVVGVFSYPRPAIESHGHGPSQDKDPNGRGGFVFVDDGGIILISVPLDDAAGRTTIQILHTTSHLVHERAYVPPIARHGALRERQPGGKQLQYVSGRVVEDEVWVQGRMTTRGEDFVHEGSPKGHRSASST